MESEHAKLPLWADKSNSEKLETLKLLIDDLYEYSLSDARQEIIKILESHVSSDEKEVHDIQIIKDSIKKYPNIFNKNCEFGHLIGSALVMDFSSGRFLLHHHKSLDLILQFGGHAEFETHLADVAMREAVEESGLSDLFFFPNEQSPRPLDIDMHLIRSSKNRPEHYHLDFRYLVGTNRPNDVSIRPTESSSYIWLTYEEVKENKYPLQAQLVRLIKKAYELYLDNSSRTVNYKENK